MNSSDPDQQQIDLDQTQAALEGGVTTLDPDTALQIVELWYNTLDSESQIDLDLSPVVEGLGELRDLLRAGAADDGGINGASVGDVLVRLGEATFVAAQQAGDERLTPALERLATALSSAGNGLQGGVERSTADEPDGGRA